MRDLIRNPYSHTCNVVHVRWMPDQVRDDKTTHFALKMISFMR